MGFYVDDRSPVKCIIHFKFIIYFYIFRDVRSILDGKASQKCARVPPSLTHFVPSRIESKLTLRTTRKDSSKTAIEPHTRTSLSP